MGNALVPIALFGWLPVVIGLFLALPPRRAVLVAFLFAWLFLPMASFKLAEGIPVYDKISATCVGVLLGVLLFDTRRLWGYRSGYIDLAMLLWCLCPIASSLSNDLGLYDGLAAAFRQTVEWGLPYFIGRLYFCRQADLRELAVALFIGGLVYAPLCLIEIKMSPQFHNWVYGYHQHSFAQTIRFGGWRPTVFMQHGLMVGMWMCMTALIGVALWFSRSIPRVWKGIPTAWPVVGLLGTAILCKSFGAVVLMAAGLAALWVAVRMRLRILVWLLIAAAPLYVALRAPAIWTGENLVAMTKTTADTDRAESLEFRLKNEDLLAAKALQRPWFGWGGWARNRVIDEYGRDHTVTDGLWIITLGTTGFLGLLASTLAFLVPTTLVFSRLPVWGWARPVAAPVIALSLVAVLYWIDCVPNAMVNPIFTLVTGGLAGCVVNGLRAIQVPALPTLPASQRIAVV